MPDLINPEFNKGKREHIIWKDELCASCQNVGNCPLLQCIYDNIIMCHSGMHVANCAVYQPDVESEYYVTPPANEGDEYSEEELERIHAVNAGALQQQIDALNNLLKTVIEEWGIIPGENL